MILKKQKNCKMEERKIANRKIKRYIFLILIILLIKILSFINMLGKILEFFFIIILDQFDNFKLPNKNYI